MTNQDFPYLPKLNPSDARTYEALCHCGTVRYTVTLSPPLDRQRVVSCNCTICSRNGYLLVYPQRQQLNLKSGVEALRNYSFGIKRSLHKFCSICGSSVFFDLRMAEHGEEPDLLGVNVSNWNPSTCFDFKTI